MLKHKGKLWSRLVITMNSFKWDEVLFDAMNI